MPLLKIIEIAKEKGILYTTKEGEKAQTFSQSISDEGSQIQLTESAQTLGLRVIALSANGFPIVRCRQHSYNLSYGGHQENISINDEDVLKEFCQRVGVELRRVEEAPDEHINILETESTRLVNSLFSLGGDFKVTFVETSAQRVIRDYTGRFLNAAHPEVAEILEAIPDALGNPIRRKLLNAYMALTYYGLSEARSLIKELLLDPGLEENSQLKTGQLLADHLRHKLKDILSRPE